MNNQYIIFVSSTLRKSVQKIQALILTIYRQKDRHYFHIWNSVTFLRTLNDWSQHKFCYETFLGLHNSVCGMDLFHGAEIVR